MSALDTLSLRLKAAFASLAGRFPSGGYYGNWWRNAPYYARQRTDYTSEVGDGSTNSAVAACVNWVATTFPEAPLRVLDRDGEPIPDHPLTDLLRSPNPWYDGLLLLQQTLVDYSITGNAFWLLGRNRSGRPTEVWYAPSWMLRPRWPDDGSEFISHYEYTPNGVPVELKPEELIHFRFGLDPITRLGVSRLGPALAEVYTDEQAALWVASLLKNMGVPGVILAPKSPDQFVRPEDADALKEDFARRFGGDQRGSVMVMHDPTDVSVLSFSPQQMDLKALRRVPEERISAALGIPAIVAGLGAGLDRSTYSNMAEAREAAYESNIIPTQRLLAATLRRQLLPHFADPARFNLAFDNSQVRVLQEDENAKAERILKLVDGTLLTIAEGRKAMGWEVGPEHEVYKLASKVSLVLPEDLTAPPPEPVAAPAQLPAPTPEEEGQDAGAKVLRRLTHVGVESAEDLESLYEERIRRSLNGGSHPKGRTCD